MDNSIPHQEIHTGRREIERVLSRIKPEDIQPGLDILRLVFESGKNHENASGLLALLKDASASNALKSIGLFIYRSWRVWSGTSLVESVAALKDLAWLRGRLNVLASELVQPNGMAAVADLPSESATEPPSDERDVILDGVIRVYQLSVGRSPAPEEIDLWKNNFSNGLKFAEFLSSMFGSAESENFLKSMDLFPGISDGRFIQLVHESILGRGCTAREISHWQQKLDAGLIGRRDILRSIYSDYLAIAESESQRVHDAYSFHVMGTGQHVTTEDWNRKAQEIKAGTEVSRIEPVFHSRFYIKQEPKLLVTAIASLYRGGKFIDQFMDNITSQSCFRDYCELVIIDADSPENESEVIERYCKQHKNIVYRRMNQRIGIYDAWNAGVKIARGEYLTNTNLDDLRRHDSLELQAAALDNLPFVDVVYQEFFYTFDPRVSIEEITRFGYKSNLPIVTAYNLMDFNSPHNAPMWRKKLHEELGYFDVSYKSAGDYEFWMRCLAAKKVFYKINDPHIAYYQNPEGLSTRPDTRGVEEARRILKTYGRRLVSENVVMPIDRFVQNLSPGSCAPDRLKESRYTTVQHALRNAAIKNKYAQDTMRTPA